MTLPQSLSTSSAVISTTHRLAQAFDRRHPLRLTLSPPPVDLPSLSGGLTAQEYWIRWTLHAVMKELSPRGTSSP